MAITGVTRTEKSLTSSGSWQDIDVSAIVPSGATGVFGELVCTSGTRSVGVRKNGSTDNRTQSLGDNSHTWFAVGVDSSRIFEGYGGDHAQVKFYILGYFTADAVFFTNGVDKSLATTTAWTDIDVSSDTGADTAKGVVIEKVHTGGDRDWGLRQNGSTDARTQLSQSDYQHIWGFVGVDGSEILEGYIQSTDVDFFLTGYFINGFTPKTNGTDLSLSSTGSYTDLTALDTGAVAGAIEVVGNNLLDYHLRKNGDSDDSYRRLNRHHWGLVMTDASRLIEGRISSTDVDFFLTGFFSLGNSYTQTCTDAITITDTRLHVKSPGRILNETLTIVDSISKRAGKVLTDRVQLTDTVARLLIFARTLTEQITIVDTIRKTTSRIFSEVLSIVDTVAGQLREFLPGYELRKKINITGQSGAGTNYQIPLKIGESSGASGVDLHVEGHSLEFPSGDARTGATDGGDFTFTKSDGVTELDFWVERVTGSAPNRVAEIWVEVADSLDANQEIFLYYKKASAANKSNGSNTFIFFDDFERSSLGTGYTTSGSPAGISASRYLLVGDGNSSHKTAETNTTFGVNTAMRSYGLVGGEAWTTSTYGYGAAFMKDWSMGNIQATAGAGYVDTGIPKGTYAVWDICRKSTGEAVFKKDGTTVATTGNLTGSYGLKIHSGNGESTAEYWLVRKYTPTEPAFSSADAEETSLIALVLNEVITVTDTVVPLKAVFKTLSETVTLVDTFARTISRRFTETITVVDRVLKTAGRILVETINVRDVYGYGLSFDGVNDKVTLTDLSAFFTATGKVAIQVKFKLNADAVNLPSSQPIISTRYFRIYVRNTNNTLIARTDNAVSARETVYVLGAGDRAVHEVVALFDGTAGTTSVLKIYVDGVWRSTHNAIDIPSTTYAQLIGSLGAGFFSGEVYLARTWVDANAGFSDTDVANMYTGTVPPNALYEYLFKQGYGTVLHDTSATPYNGTIDGATWLTLGIQKLTSRPLSETITVVDRVLRVSSRLFTEMIKVNDVVTSLKLFYKPLDETITVTDRVLKTAARNLLETIRVNDAVIRVATLFRTFTENITIVDRVIKVTNRTFRETVSVTDSFLKMAGRRLNETITITDTFLRQFTRVLTENITIVDTVAKLRAIMFTEVITIRDSLLRAFLNFVRRAPFIEGKKRGENSQTGKRDLEGNEGDKKEGGMTGTKY